MTNFVDKLCLKGKADENQYFARKEKEIIDALSKKLLARLAAESDAVKNSPSPLSESSTRNDDRAG